MTLQLDRQRDGASTTDLGTRATRRAALATAAALVAAVGAVSGVVVSHLEARSQETGVVLGESLRPLPIYPATFRKQGAAPKGAKTVPEMGEPGQVAVLTGGMRTELHVRYAHVRAVAGRWQVEFYAPEGATFNVDSTKGKFFAAVPGKDALPLFFVYGSTDRTNFAVGGGPTPLTREQAVGLAEALTTSVRIG